LDVHHVPVCIFEDMMTGSALPPIIESRSEYGVYEIVELNVFAVPIKNSLKVLCFLSHSG